MRWISYRFYLELNKNSEYNFQMMFRKNSKISTIAYNLSQDHFGLNDHKKYINLKAINMIIT
jgi:hypothetical protein